MGGNGCAHQLKMWLDHRILIFEGSRLGENVLHPCLLYKQPDSGKQPKRNKPLDVGELPKTVITVQTGQTSQNWKLAIRSEMTGNSPHQEWPRTAGVSRIQCA